MNIELPFVKDMFDSIAPRYDLLNRALSARRDVAWRRMMVAAMDIPHDGLVLDAACGTADVGLEILRQKGKTVRVVGVDFSPAMLEIGKAKVVDQARSDKIDLVAGNTLHLPFGTKIFDAITIAFGIRNIQDRPAALKIFHDSLKPGGILLVLELATPQKGPVLSLYLFYFKKLLPLIGKMVSGNSKAYMYLPDSVAKFPNARDFADQITSAGFTDVGWKRLTLGIAVLFYGRKAA